MLALFFGSCVFFSGVVRAEKIDFSTTTCKHLEGHKGAIGLVLTWLDGH